jgi:mono/diheme cytochrome c family protein
MPIAEVPMRVVLVPLLALGLACGATPEEQVPDDPNRPLTAADLAGGAADEGELVYGEKCAWCHGEDAGGGQSVGGVRGPSLRGLSAERFLAAVNLPPRAMVPVQEDLKAEAKHLFAWLSALRD